MVQASWCRAWQVPLASTLVALGGTHTQRVDRLWAAILYEQNAMLVEYEVTRLTTPR
jgi:hypothetical protein